MSQPWPHPQPSAPPCPGKPVNHQCGWSIRCPCLLGCISHDGWSCYPPHWYSARLWCWARSLTLNGYLLPQSPPASGAQRGSVSGRRGWMELPSGRASQPSQTARQPQLTFPPSNGLRSLGRLQVRSDRPGHTERQRGREEWRGDIVPFPSTLLFLTSLSFSLLCWENSDV